jgi:hypothetical protein
MQQTWTINRLVDVHNVRGTAKSADSALVPATKCDPDSETRVRINVLPMFYSERL